MACQFVFMHRREDIENGPCRFYGKLVKLQMCALQSEEPQECLLLTFVLYAVLAIVDSSQKKA